MGEVLEVESCEEVVEVVVRDVVALLDEVEVTTSVDVCVAVVVVVPPAILLATKSLDGLRRRSDGQLLSAGRTTTFAQFESSKSGLSHPAGKLLSPTHRILDPVTSVSVCVVP
jgi:hypothetical protein